MFLLGLLFLRKYTGPLVEIFLSLIKVYGPLVEIFLSLIKVYGPLVEIFLSLIKVYRFHCKNQSSIHKKNTSSTTRGVESCNCIFTKLFSYFLQWKPYDFIG